MPDTAPLRHDLAEGPPGGAAWWLRTADGVRIRMGHWPGSAAVGSAGTVFLFPGRTEYVEKYGRLAGDLAAQGYGMLAIDWRGQGLADRLLADRMVGHVNRFADYQRDVDAVVAAAQAMDLPKPWFLMTHSMGGCIGLRSLLKGMPVKAAAFSAPMWGIGIKPHLRPGAWVVSTLAPLVGKAGAYSPGTGPTTYVVDAPYEDNTLTTDRDMWDYMGRQVRGCPELALGGPSMRWLNESLKEMRKLRQGPLPTTPTLVGLGLQERIVDPMAVRAVMARWSAAEFLLIDGAEHEIIMETPAIRARFLAAAVGLFQRSV
jgi:lysophospholipase